MPHQTAKSSSNFLASAKISTLLLVAAAIAVATLASSDARASDHLVYFQIWRIEAANQIVDVRPGQRIQLRLNVYDREGNLLNEAVDEMIQDDALFRWIGEGEFSETRGIPLARKSGRPDDRVVDHTVSRNPGIYSIVAGLIMPDLCAPERVTGCTGRGTASFTIRAARTSTVTTAAPADPTDPPGPIPSQITDDDNNLYSVAIPSEGGEDTVDRASIQIPRAAVNNNTYVGIRISQQDPAINAQEGSRRFTVGGDWYQVDIVNSKGQVILDYRLGSPASVCLPMPDPFRPYLSDIMLVEGIGFSRILTSNPRFDAEHGWRTCGATSSLPGIFAVAVRGDRSDLLPPSPTPAPTEAPIVVISVGGQAPATSTAIFWSILGAIAIAIGATMFALPALRRKRGRQESHGG